MRFPGEGFGESLSRILFSNEEQSWFLSPYESICEGIYGRWQKRFLISLRISVNFNFGRRPGCREQQGPEASCDAGHIPAPSLGRMIVIEIVSLGRQRGQGRLKTGETPRGKIDGRVRVPVQEDLAARN
jgi:hypothetical protein